MIAFEWLGRSRSNEKCFFTVCHVTKVQTDSCSQSATTMLSMEGCRHAKCMRAGLSIPSIVAVILTCVFWQPQTCGVQMSVVQLIMSFALLWILLWPEPTSSTSAVWLTRVMQMIVLILLTAVGGAQQANVSDYQEMDPQTGQISWPCRTAGGPLSMRVELFFAIWLTQALIPLILLCSFWLMYAFLYGENDPVPEWTRLLGLWRQNRRLRRERVAPTDSASSDASLSSSLSSSSANRVHAIVWISPTIRQPLQLQA